MLRSLNTSATGMVAQQFNLDVISNNLANVNTTGFKHQRAEFHDLVYQTVQSAGTSVGQNFKTPGGVQFGLGSMVSATANDLSQGASLSTGNPLDLMIVGEGYFRVLKPDGSFGYTRDGSFKKDATGLLVNSNGYPLVPQITIPEGATQVNIGQDGTVEAMIPGNSTPTRLDQITLAMFANPAGLTRAGENLWVESAASGAPNLIAPGTDGAGTVSAGYLEGSNVSVVEEMVRMITAQRAYEINSKAIQTSDDMLSILNTLKR
ncbi:MAG: flagellar basal-body rod protein FlgG [Armatimonadetes bacterium]|nr:flagellar basal-body rod protein FlgG [Armatimonadota bacterium]MBS1704205.1 flagellar basal-body rod protein FlgG [Armatimonadota bacterium]MBS1727002.1 flagellar basal-body rod protein FlgG [Armatimonadota bacterium]